MHHYNANASVIYTDAAGQKFDTFVIFDTDSQTGLTHINHENLKVATTSLELHPKTVCAYHLPLDDAFSFEMLKKLRDKYNAVDSAPKTQVANIKQADLYVLAKAS